MKEIFKPTNLIILLLSIVGLYILAPSLDRENGPFVSLSFALILIVSSKMIWDRQHIVKYISFIVIDMITYFILYNDEPWDLLFHTGLWSNSAIPLIGCSIIMAFTGWLLIEKWNHRWIYVMITLGLQIPIGVFIGGVTLQELFGNMAHRIRFTEYYPGALQVWQFEWMLTYYLPIYFFARSKQ